MKLTRRQLYVRNYYRPWGTELEYTWLKNKSCIPNPRKYKRAKFLTWYFYILNLEQEFYINTHATNNDNRNPS